MGIATFPASSGGISSVVKSLQRGTAASAGNITISAVDTTKTTVNSFSTSSSGSVAATGTINAANGSTSATSTSAMSGYGAGLMANTGGNTGTIGFVGGNYNWNSRYQVTGGPYGSMSMNMNFNSMNINGANVGLNATNITGGSTSLTSASFGAYLTSSTNIYATGPCQYEVVEYY